MIVQFVMTLSISFWDQTYLWFFYKSLNNYKKFGWPIIAQEEYYLPPSYFEKIGRREVSNKNMMDKMGYDKPTDEDLENLDKYIIHEALEQDLIRKTSSRNDAFHFILSQRWKEFESLLEQYILEIEMKHGKQIKAILTLCHYPSLSFIAEKHGIKVIHMELGTFRKPLYADTAFFDFDNLYGGNTIEKRYNAFLEQFDDRKDILLDNKEILSLMLSSEYLTMIDRFRDSPKYKLGLALGYTVWPLFQKQSLMDDYEMLWLASKEYENEDILVRYHPADPHGAKYPRFTNCRDYSPNSLEFLLQCEEIATLGSNVAIEAMLFNRNAYVFTRSPAYYMAKHTFHDKKKNLCPLEYLNFFIFCYLVPFKCWMDQEYIFWRLSNPSEIEIFNKHMEYYLGCKNINLAEFLKLSGVERLQYMLKCQNYNPNEKPRYATPKPRRIIAIIDYQNEINRLEKEVKRLSEGMANEEKQDAI